MRRRAQGATLVEVLFTLSLTVVVVGTATLMYGQAMKGTYTANALAELGLQGDFVGKRWDDLIAQATSATTTTLNGKPALKLVMPATKGAADNLGFYNSYTFDNVHPRLGPIYSQGNRVWIFYLSAVTPYGGRYVVAERTDDANPTAADVDWNQSFLDPAGKTQPRYPMGMTVTFTVTPSTRTVQTSIAMTAGTTTQGVAGVTPEDQKRVITIVRNSRYLVAAP